MQATNTLLIDPKIIPKCLKGEIWASSSKGYRSIFAVRGISLPFWRGYGGISDETGLQVSNFGFMSVKKREKAGKAEAQNLDSDGVIDMVLIRICLVAC
jgi:hypothetical protein